MTAFNVLVLIVIPLTMLCAGGTAVLLQKRSDRIFDAAAYRARLAANLAVVQDRMTGPSLGARVPGEATREPALPL
jgi:hypothetical protein